MMPNEGYFSSLKTIGRYFSSLKSLFLSIQKNIKRLLELLLRILNERLVYLIIGQIQMLKTRMHLTPTSTHTCTLSLYEHLQKFEPVYLKIDEATADALLWMDMSSSYH